MDKAKQLNHKQLILYIVLFVSILSVCRFAWVMLFDDNLERPEIQDGVIDLRESDSINEGTIELDGKWLFSPNQLFTVGSQVSNESQHITVPHDWSEDGSSYNYGTYHLKVLVNAELTDTYSIKVPSARTASELYVNGEQVAKSGDVSPNQSQFTAKNLPYTVSVAPNDTGVIDITLQVANFVEQSEGGLVRSVIFGESSNVRTNNLFSYSMQIIVMVAFIIYAIYAIGLFVINDRNWNFIHISLLLLGAIVTHSLGSHEKLLAYWLQLELEWNIKLAHLATLVILFSLWMIIKNDTVKFNFIPRWVICSVFSLMTIVLLLISVDQAIYLQDVFSFLLIFGLIGAIAIIYRQTNNKSRESLWLLLALVSLLHSYIWWGIWIEQGINITYYPIDLVVTIGCFSIMWLGKYMSIYRHSKDQAVKLKRVAEEKDDFLAKTSHELRDPLHNIINLTQTNLKRNKHMLDETSARELETVVLSSNRLSLLLDDLFEMANLKITEPKIQFDSFYLQSLISGILDLFYFKLDDRKVRLINDVSDQLPPIYADEKRVIQILYNLIHNAVKFTCEGDIVVSAKRSQNKITVTVADSGDGMDNDTLNNAFIPYEQGKQKAAKSEGMGLGLSISKQLIELHGEQIFIESAPSKGTITTFTLPVSDSNPVHDSNTSLVTSNVNNRSTFIDENKFENTVTHHPRVLIVDDDVTNLNVIESILANEDYEITSTTDGHELLKNVDLKQWDLLIIDVMMPGVSGFDLTNKIRKRYSSSELPILLLTARQDTSDIVTGLKVGANDYITKPVNARELQLRVRNLININRANQKQLEMESKWLQAQIQPHFIFNTLNTINALSNIDVRKMNQLIEEFSHLLRNKFNFDSFDHSIPVSEELSIVNSFLYIEKLRFGEKLQVSWDVEDIESFYIPRLTIQPIVENAIKHGILKQVEGGKIEIKAFRRENYLRIIIKDNGVGMGYETVQSIKSIDHRSSQGVGLINTNWRLKKHSSSGLTIRSRVGVGTIIAFNISKHPVNVHGGDLYENSSY
ncbi:ATP-binding protein [Alkalibacillus sp. S2W]|uniref:ATP-binding protein n=1 Tax=Alkalibacillus sp. S2W TaxID=3386553 RepID=UPI00398D2400